jgi:hypothetical protein
MTNGVSLHNTLRDIKEKKREGKEIHLLLESEVSA